MSPEKNTSLSPAEQLALSDIAARNNWSEDQIALATSQLTDVGQKELKHSNEQMLAHDDEVKRGLGLTALTAKQQMALDSLAANGADQDRVDAAASQMAAKN